MSAETFWHGRLLNRWAQDWVAYLTDGQGAYVTTETNDSGAMVAIAGLAAAGRADPNRVLLLRTASNFDMPPEGVTAAADVADAGPGSYAAYLPALETAYDVGIQVVHEITCHWDRDRDAVPGAPARAR